MFETIDDTVQCCIKTDAKIIEEALCLGVDACLYCRYSAQCPKGVVSYGNGPQYPPCADKDALDYFDIEAYLTDMEEEHE